MPKLKIQSVLFDKDEYDIQSAIKWLKEHNLIYPKIHITKDKYRFRQHPPDKFDDFITKKVIKGITFIIGIKKQIK